MIIKRCGNEGEWPHNTPQQTRDREFLQKGISFLTEVLDHERGLDLENAALIFCIPGRDFCVTSENHRSEFVIFEERGEIQAKCCRMPTARWLWNAARNCWGQIVDYARNSRFKLWRNLVLRVLSYPSLRSERERDPGWVWSRGPRTKLIPMEESFVS